MSIEGTGTREKILIAAAALFASDGYSGTSVADIQAACGLAPGSGALYKHFGSKRDLLGAVVAAHVTTMRAGRASFQAAAPSDDPHAALELLAGAVLTAMSADRDLLRVCLRDLEDFPELLTDLWHEVHTQIYGEFRVWVGEQVATGRASSPDPAATAGVLMAALTQYGTLRALIGRAPGNLSQRRFVRGWVALALSALEIPDARTATSSRR